MLNVTKANQLNAQASGMLIDAGTLYTQANLLAGKAKGQTALDDEALKQKAGETPNDGLRGLAKTLYDSAKALQDAVSAGAGDGDEKAAENLATAVGQTESTGIRNALKLLAEEQTTSQLSKKAQDVRDAYEKGTNGVKPKFEAVKGKKETYKSAGKESEYQAVVEAWEAFNALYDADLKKLAKELNGAANTLSGSPTVTTAQNFKEEYDAFKLKGKSTITITGVGNSDKKNITITNLPNINDTFKPRQIKFWVIIFPSIVSQWLNLITYVIL
ncbi:Tpr-related protein family member, putative [Theileria annulata]|uniref:Tpr-related protein family member, putative n=1 Tax=Theileria annulata TaxID=5874 RepID=Q4UFF4_THEAN|nr:Tpr-related protein family member, putative [Theileria annulata]CAI74162.1 Tpr-related protein family member, putative [Theileria annulata]|eukprot:XP_951894.1 Tpr-related protein family member, putative [Theileria annulata]